MTENFDLSTVFKTVTEALKESQSNLDAADEYNSNHGTHMVETFDLIQKAVESKSDLPASDQLAFASEQLRFNTTSGSAKLYADGLQDAAEQFKGKEFNQKSAGTLINALMGSKPSAEGGSGDFLSTLLGGMTGSSQAKPQPQAHQPAPGQPDDLVGSLLGNIPQQTSNQPQAQPGEDLLSTLLGGMGGAQAQQQQPQQDAGGDLLSTLLGGMGGAQAQQQQPPAQSAGGDLLSTLLGGMGGAQAQQQQQPSQSAGGDLLSTLLGGMGGSQTQQQPQQSQSGGGDLLSTLLGGLGGSSSSSQSSGGGMGDLLSTLLGGQSSGQSSSNGLDGKDLLSAALAYFSAKRKGQSNMQAIMQAISAASRFGGSKDRAQSGAVVVDTILNMMGAN